MKKILMIIVMFTLFLPTQVFAHEGEVHSAEESFNAWNYGVILMGVILLLAVILLFTNKVKANKLDLKKKENRVIQQSLQRKSTLFTWVAIGSLVLGFVMFMISNNTGENSNESKVTFKHIHGLGYTSDGTELYVPAHDGLRVYKNGEWTVPEKGEKHDYMGFSMYKGGFYSSGHPAPNSELENPMGIVKSTDLGESLELLDLYKEIDFHGMTVGYETKDIYVFNPEQNSRMEQTGFYYSTDETKTWNKAEFNGVKGQATTLAAHPTKEGIVAIGTDQGIFLSEDFGNTFESIVSETVTAISFGFENQLLVGTIIDGEPQLITVDLTTRDVEQIGIPHLEEDAVSYIQQNPVNHDEIVFATYERDIYFSSDYGVNWVKSVNKGVSNSH